MPLCPNCCSSLKKRNNSQGKYYHCPRHGFVRNIGTPEKIISVIAENSVSVLEKISRPTKLKLNIGDKNE